LAAEPAGAARGAAERRAREILDRQLRLDAPAAAVDTGPAPDTSIARWFVPGNHDWNDRSVWSAFFGPPRDGLARAQAQGAYLHGVRGGGADVALLPPAGCPGPVVRDVGRWLRVIAIDTQWWLAPSRAAPGAAACDDVADRATAAARLRQAVGDAGDRRVIVVGHHPLATAGPHGGYCGGRLGCVLARPFRLGLAHFTGRQDLSNRPNVSMRRALESALAPAPGARRALVYAAGHEHTLQVFRGGAADWYLVSGSGNAGHTSPVGCRGASTFARAEGGFMRLDVTGAGLVRLTVFTADAGGRPVVRYRRWLTEPSGRATPDDGATC